MDSIGTARALRVLGLVEEEGEDHRIAKDHFPLSIRKENMWYLLSVWYVCTWGVVTEPELHGRSTST